MLNTLDVLLICSASDGQRRWTAVIRLHHSQPLLHGRRRRGRHVFRTIVELNVVCHGHIVVSSSDVWRKVIMTAYLCSYALERGNVF